MDREILIFAAMNVIGGLLAFVFVHVYYLPNVENSTIEPALYELTQRDHLAVDPTRR